MWPWGKQELCKGSGGCTTELLGAVPQWQEEMVWDGMGCVQQLQLSLYFINYRIRMIES